MSSQKTVRLFIQITLTWTAWNRKENINVVFLERLPI